MHIYRGSWMGEWAIFSLKFGNFIWNIDKNYGEIWPRVQNLDVRRTKYRLTGLKFLKEICYFFLLAATKRINGHVHVYNTYFSLYISTLTVTLNTQSCSFFILILILKEYVIKEILKRKQYRCNVHIREQKCGSTYKALFKII